MRQRQRKLIAILDDGNELSISFLAKWWPVHPNDYPLYQCVVMQDDAVFYQHPFFSRKDGSIDRVVTVICEEIEKRCGRSVSRVTELSLC